jgi:hypothetical protein
MIAVRIAGIYGCVGVGVALLAGVLDSWFAIHGGGVRDLVAIGATVFFLGGSTLTGVFLGYVEGAREGNATEVLLAVAGGAFAGMALVSTVIAGVTASLVEAAPTVGDLAHIGLAAVTTGLVTGVAAFVGGYR